MSTFLQFKSPRSYGSLEASPVTPDKTCATGDGPATASLLSRLLFGFVHKLFEVGNARQLNMGDVWEPACENVPSIAFDAFNARLTAHNGSIMRAIVATYGGALVVSGLSALFTAACAVFAPAMLHHVIEAFAAPVIDLEDVYVWLGAFFASRVVNTLASAQGSYLLEVASLRLTIALKALVFRKAARRSTQSKSDAKAVDISNLYTSDLETLMYAANMFNNIWVLPLQIAVAVYILYAVIGLAAFVGFGVIVASMVVSVYIARTARSAFKDAMQRKDARLATIKEVFGAIQIVKLNAWEPQFARKIRERRAAELTAVKRCLLVSSSSIFLLWASPIFVSTLLFAVYVLVLQQTLTAAKVFTAIALFNAIRDPLRMLPSTIQQLTQAKVALERVSAFLALEEYNENNVAREDLSQPDNVVIAIENGSFGWSKDSPAVLQNVDLRVKRGDFVVVHGGVGSGKSSLCSALPGEMSKLSGRVFVRGSSKVTYYLQQPWIQHRTIRDNIVFGNAFDARKYENVLDACGLVPDLAGFPGGDATEIGEKGVNLSGGQKARVALARACYSDADVFILDSLLAAVDAVVQREIFSKCICTLLERKTIVLITHSPDIIASEAANYKVLVQDGEVVGKRSEIAKPRSSFAPVLSPREVDETQELVTAESKAALAIAGRLVADEEREDGRVSAQVFLNYFHAVGGLRVCTILLVVQTLWQGFQIGSDLWLSHWTEQALDASSNGTNVERNLIIYALLGAGAVLMVLGRVVVVALLGLRASMTLFDAMTRSLLHAPLRFFDANPLGRIVNRFSEDMAMIDFQIPFALGTVAANLFFAFFKLATAVYMVGFLGVLVVPLVYLYVKVGNFCLAPSRELSRLWKIGNSPILSHVSETEAGIALIRAFGPAYTERAVAENLQRIGVVNRVELITIAATQWFQLHMQLIGCSVVVVVVSSLVYLRAYLSPGLVGLAFSYALTIDNSIMRLVQAYSYTEIMMVSPERVLEYASISAEGSDKLLAIEPPSQWPQHGSITFQDVVFSYKPGAPAVLKGLSFEIKANEKIGIVGRTGAGKSSLSMALFRINELDAGCILIDGQDISSMPLRSLRSRLSIIPQSPALFKGTLRAYMDPFEEYSDAQIWVALEKAEMKTQIAALEQQLSHELSENGENFSVGERQMLCMARALLTQAHIIVMDEATAPIDHATEKKLQAMIVLDFQDVTVLTIAHRLATVLDSDRIMVLRDGEVVEFDSPRKLAKDPSSAFYELAKEGGYLTQLQ